MTESTKRQVVNRLASLLPVQKFPNAEPAISYWLHHQGSVLLVLDQPARNWLVFDSDKAFRFFFDAYGN